MKKMTSLLAVMAISAYSFCQETLQSVTERGNTTNTNISIFGTGNNYIRGVTAFDSTVFAQRSIYTPNWFSNIWGYSSLNTVTCLRAPINSKHLMLFFNRNFSAGIYNVAGTVFSDSLTYGTNTGADGYSSLLVSPYIVQTGYTGVVRGIQINPALTGVTNFRAIETNVSRGNGYQIYAGGTAHNYFKGRTTIDSTWVFNHDTYFGSQTFATAIKTNSFTFYNSNSSISIQKSNSVSVFPFTRDALRIFSFGNTNVSNSNWNGVGTYDSITVTQNILSASINQFRVGGKITQTGFTGPIQGININTELIGANEFRALQTNNNKGTGYQVYAGGTATSYFGGSVCIGTTDPKDYQLAIAGNAIAERIVVKKYNTWPDYVFDSTYQLASLNDIDKYIRQYKHLPDVPSANEVKDKGLDVGDNQAILLRKIEELTLYIIEQNRQLDRQKQQNSSLETRLLTVEKLLAEIKNSLR